MKRNVNPNTDNKQSQNDPQLTTLISCIVGEILKDMTRIKEEAWEHAGRPVPVVDIDLANCIRAVWQAHCAEMDVKEHIILGIKADISEGEMVNSPPICVFLSFQI